MSRETANVSDKGSFVIPEKERKQVSFSSSKCGEGGGGKRTFLWQDEVIWQVDEATMSVIYYKCDSRYALQASVYTEKKGKERLTGKNGSYIDRKK